MGLFIVQQTTGMEKDILAKLLIVYNIENNSIPKSEPDIVFVINDNNEKEWFSFTRFRLFTNADLIKDQFEPYTK